MAYGDNDKKPLMTLLAYHLARGENQYMSHIMLGIEREMSRKVKDIAIKFSGLSITFQFNPDYYDSLPSFHQQMSFVLHNIVHLIYKHPMRYNATYDKDLFNIACDLIVNQAIPGHVLDDTATLELFKEFKLERNQSLDYYYTKLYKENESMKDMDVKDFNSAQRELDSMLSTDNPSNHNWDDLNEAEQQLLSDNMDDRMLDANERTERGRGTSPAYFTDIINLILESRKPVLDWRKEFRKFVNNSSVTCIKNTVKRISKRYGTNPGIKIERLKRILVALDTSGSVNLKDLAEFFVEIHHMWQANADIHIIECDAAISREPYRYEGIPPEEITGRGGTDFQPVMDYVLDGHFTPDCIIYFTDGFCPPPTEYPDERKIMWIICSTGSNDFGKLPGTVVKMMG